MGGYRRRSGSDATDHHSTQLGHVIDALSTRWGVLTVEAIHHGHTRFNELRRHVAGISHKVLIHTLRSMQRDGFVVGPLSDPDLAEYLLTDLGSDLVGLIGELRAWSEDRGASMGRVIGTLSARWDVPTIEAIHAGYTHFNELQRKHAGINHKVLIDTLRSLQRDGFVHGPLTGADMTGYQLTELGVDLVDLVADIRWWSADRWPELTEARHRFANAVS